MVKRSRFSQATATVRAPREDRPDVDRRRPPRRRGQAERAPPPRPAPHRPLPRLLHAPRAVRRGDDRVVHHRDGDVRLPRAAARRAAPPRHAAVCRQVGGAAWRMAERPADGRGVRAGARFRRRVKNIFFSFPPKLSDVLLCSFFGERTVELVITYSTR